MIVKGEPRAGVVVTAWSQTEGTAVEARTDEEGSYAFEDLDPRSLYNLMVNARWEDGPVRRDESFGYAVRDNVQLTAGPDGWHGEDFVLDR